MRTLIATLALLLAASVASARQPQPRAHFYPPPAPVVRQEGTYYYVQRPCWLGQVVFGGFWVLVPHQPQQPQYQQQPGAQP